MINENSKDRKELPVIKDNFNDSVILQTILDQRRPNKEKLFPIRYRITQNRKQFYYGTGMYCSISDWKDIDSKKTESIKLRNSIKKGHDSMKDNIEIVLENNNQLFSFEKFNNLTKKNLSDTINSAFLAKIESTKVAGKIGTSIFYGCALQSIIKFKDDKIKFPDITVTWLEKYRDYMINNGASYTTVGMYCRAIRSILNEAIKAGTIREREYPFGKGKFEIPTGEGRNMALTIQQVGELMRTDVSITESKYRDLWFFSYLCNGINIADLCRLKHSDIKSDIISFYRQKTINTLKKKVKIEAVMLPQMKQIIERWNEGKKQSEYLFPFLNGIADPVQIKKTVQNVTRMINEHIKRIAMRIGINEISTYTARHSYATVLKRSGTSISFISESLGHTDTKTTQSYLDSFEKDEQIKNANKLIPTI
ncbi:MAG: site-specific integrase [Bacteroidota bacterium]